MDTPAVRRVGQAERTPILVGRRGQFSLHESGSNTQEISAPPHRTVVLPA
jgi:hypothetical protein